MNEITIEEIKRFATPYDKNNDRIISYALELYEKYWLLFLASKGCYNPDNNSFYYPKSCKRRSFFDFWKLHDKEVSMRCRFGIIEYNTSDLESLITRDYVTILLNLNRLRN